MMPFVPVFALLDVPVFATSPWDVTLAISTAVLALATVALAIAAVWAGVVALRELKHSQAIAIQGHEALEQAARLADADTRRRRAEVSHAALRRFMKVHSEQHVVMLTAARAVTAKRIEANGGDPLRIDRCSIEELLKTPKAPEPAVNALQECLDALEEVAVGIELGVYDVYVIYHGAAGTIRQLLQEGREHIKRTHRGEVPHRPAQPTAYKQALKLVDERFVAIEQEGAPTRLAGALED